MFTKQELKSLSNSLILELYKLAELKKPYSSSLLIKVVDEEIDEIRKLLSKVNELIEEAE